MESLNYHHLRYFWVVAREGTISAACRELRVAQPTISAQLRTLERSLGERLFARVGRNLSLTDTGRVVFQYANEIFSIGRDLIDNLKGRPVGRAPRFSVGVTDVLPKLVAYRLLEPAFHLADPVRPVCSEGNPTELLGRLATHELDLVLSDSPIGTDVNVRGFNHLLGECGVAIFGTKELATAYRRRFPASLDGAPFLIPTENAALHRALEYWFYSEDIRPSVVAEFEDSALLKVFGQAGVGLFAAPTVIEQEVRRQYGVRVVGRLESVRERFYAISVERKVKHPAVLAIADEARQNLFS